MAITRLSERCSQHLVVETDLVETKPKIIPRSSLRNLILVTKIFLHWYIHNDATIRSATVSYPMTIIIVSKHI